MICKLKLVVIVLVKLNKLKSIGIFSIYFSFYFLIIFRLITANTYEREMFDKASLKLGMFTF